MFKQRAISLRISFLNSAYVVDGCSDLHLSHLPAARHRQQHSLFKLDRLKWFGRIGFAIGRSVGVEDAGEVGGGFRCGKYRERESSQLCEQRQRRRDVGNAPNLSRPIAAEVVQYRVAGTVS